MIIRIRDLGLFLLSVNRVTESHCTTVKRHIANAYGKLGVTHRTEAVARANELKLV